MLQGVEIPKDLAPPVWGEMGEDVFKRTYARAKGLKDGAKEEWEDTVKRVVDGNCAFVDDRYIEKDEPERLFNLIYNFMVLPGGRHLWCTGVQGRPFISNCWAAGWDKSDFSRHFTFSFGRLMEGGGVGANYSNPYLKDYAPIPARVNLHLVCDTGHKDYELVRPMLSDKYSAEWRGAFQTPDSREGWVETLGMLMQAHYQMGESLHNGDLVIDVSHIRPSGTKLKTFGGTASGPRAFVEMLVNINVLLNKRKGRKPNSVLCMELDHEIAKCVVSGNVRRSARMSMKHWKDHDVVQFVKLKKDSNSHWTTNISVVVDKYFFQGLRKKDKKALQILRLISSGALENGEPGLFNITKAKEGEVFAIYSTNPCGEIPLPEWGSCNLGSLNLSKFAYNEAALKEAARLLTRFLLRATFAKCNDALAQAVIERDRRIGVGLTGFADWLAMEGVKFSQFPTAQAQQQILKNVAKTVREAARKYAFELRIPEPVKTTMLAPTGTSAKLCGCSEGGQPILYKHFLRRVLYSKSDEGQRAIVEKAIHDGLHVEDSVYTPDTSVVSYICRAKILENPQVSEDLLEEAADISLDDCLDVQRTLQDIWADNAISFTINVDADKMTRTDIMRVLQAFGPYLKGTTIMPRVSDRPQMPYERITKEEWENATVKHSGAGELECKNNSCSLIGAEVMEE